MELEILKEKIDKGCRGFVDFAKEIEKLPPVTHRSKSFIQFRGGLLGGIQEYRESKRLEKLINEPIYNGKSFCKLASYLIEELEKLVALQKEVQSKTGSNNDDEVNKIWKSFNIAVAAWYNYSPDMAEAEIGENANLSFIVREEGERLIESLDSNLFLDDEINENSGGCFGICILLLSIGIGCSFLLI